MCARNQEVGGSRLHSLRYFYFTVIFKCTLFLNYHAININSNQLLMHLKINICNDRHNSYLTAK